VEWGEAKKRARQAHHERPDVIIGKKGITDEVLREIERRLAAKGVVKVRMLRTAVDQGRARREAARYVAARLNAKLMGVRGRTFVLYRERAGKSSILSRRPGTGAFPGGRWRRRGERSRGARGYARSPRS